MMPFPAGRRRWPRHDADLPVRVALSGQISSAAVPGRITEISEGGVALCAGMNSKLSDVLEIEFQTLRRARLTGVVRSRAGYCFGLELLTPLVSDDEARTPWSRMAAAEPATVTLITPAAAKMLEKVLAARGNPGTFARLAQVLQIAGRPAEAQRASDRAVELLLENRDAYLRKRELEIKRLRREIEALHRIAPLLTQAEDQNHVPPSAGVMGAFSQAFRRWFGRG